MILQLTRRVVDIYVASTACPVLSIAVDNGGASFKLNPFRAAPSSAWSCAKSIHTDQSGELRWKIITAPDHLFIDLRVTFSIGPPRCAANLLVNTSESRKRWSGRRRGCDTEGLGRIAYAIAVETSVGLCEGAFKIFLGSSDNGVECRISGCRRT